MATVPILSSSIDIFLNNVPEVSDPELYQALLEIHSAIEAILAVISTGEDEVTPIEELERLKAIKVVNANYAMQNADGTVLVSSSLSDITISLPDASANLGVRYRVKVINDTFRSYVRALGLGTIDNETGAFELFLMESLEVQSDGNNWWIV